MEKISRKYARQHGLTYYFTGKPCKHGHIDKRITNNGSCYSCLRKSTYQWYHTGKKSPEWVKQRKFKSLRNHAIAKGVEFTLVYDDLHWPTHCPVLGIELDYSGADRQRQVSFDRTDSTKGYTPDNTVIMSMRANSLKQDTTREEARLLYEYLMRNLD